MCCTIVLSAPDFSLAVVDSRWTWNRVGGRETESWHEDIGLKLRRVQSGWAAATGDARLCALALRELETVGVSATRQAFEVALAETREHFGERDPRLTHVFGVGDDGSIEVASTEGHESIAHSGKAGRFDCRISWPPNLSDELERELHAALARRIREQREMAAVIHCVIHAFREAREHDPVSMSDTIEIGLSTLPGYYGQATGYQGYLKARPADIVLGSSLKFTRPPEPEPFPNVAEARLFGLTAIGGGAS